MLTAERQAHWNAVYATKAEDEVSWFEPLPQLSLDLIGKTELPKTGAVIDIGGGLSHLADHLACDGYTDLTVIDVSSEAIRRLQERLGPGSHIRGIAADITEWKPDRAYDVWHDRAVLHFLVDDTERSAYRAALLAGVRSGGQAIIATFAPTGPQRCSGLDVRRYGRDELASFVGSDFECLESFEFEHTTPVGRAQRFHVGRFIRRAEQI